MLVHLHLVDDVGSHLQTVLQLVEGREEYFLDNLATDLAEVMKKLAKDKMLRALSNVDYAKGDYEKEMGQAALKKEALKVTYRYKQ